MTERPPSPPEDDATSKEAARFSPSSNNGVDTPKSLCCSVASRPDIATIDEAIRAGESHRKISRRFPGLTRDAVHAHAPHVRSVHEGQAPASAGLSILRAREDLDPQLLECPKDRESRVREVMRLLASGRWETGTTGPVLAAAWGVTDAAMGSYAAEASRRVKAVTDPEYVRTRLSTALDEGIDRSRLEPKDLAAVAKAFMPLVGIGGAQLSVKVVMEHPMLAEMFGAIRSALEPHPEAMAAVERALVELEEKRRGGATVPALEG